MIVTYFANQDKYVFAVANLLSNLSAIFQIQIYPFYRGRLQENKFNQVVVIYDYIEFDINGKNGGFPVLGDIDKLFSSLATVVIVVLATTTNFSYDVENGKIIIFQILNFSQGYVKKMRTI